MFCYVYEPASATGPWNGPVRIGPLALAEERGGKPLNVSGVGAVVQDGEPALDS